jgi:hypothetical protein
LDLVDAEVHHDPVQPGVEARGALEGADVLVHLDEGFLDDVERVGLVLDDAEGHREGTPVVAFIELAKGGLIPGLQPLDELHIDMTPVHLRLGDRRLDRPLIQRGGGGMRRLGLGLRRLHGRHL